MIQRRLAWPLHKDDMQICEAFHIFKTQRDWVEREVEGGDQDGEHMYIYGWFMSMYDKNHYNIVK